MKGNLENTRLVAELMDGFRDEGIDCEQWELDPGEDVYRSSMNVIARFSRERDAVVEQGCTPLIIKADTDTLNSLSAMRLHRLSEPLIRDVQTLRLIPSDFAREVRECIKESRIIDGNALLVSLLDDVKERIAALRLRWSHLEDADYQAPFLDFTADAPIIFAKLPTKKSYEAPAFFSGMQSGRLKPSFEIAVFKYWHEKFGAQPFAISSNSWNFVVERPAKDVHSAVELMLEQIAFCPSLLKYSDLLDFRDGWALNAPRWGFRWHHIQEEKPWLYELNDRRPRRQSGEAEQEKLGSLRIFPCTN